jgi:hypothetical protein
MVNLEIFVTQKGKSNETFNTRRFNFLSKKQNRTFRLIE